MGKASITINTQPTVVDWFLNHFVVPNKYTTIEEQILRTKGLEGKHPNFLDVIPYHNFIHFTCTLQHYKENWLCEFYEDY